MKKRFIAKRRKKKNFKLRLGIIFIILIFLFMISVTYNYFLKNKYVTDNSVLVNIIMMDGINYKKSDNSLIKKKVLELFIPYKIIGRNYKGLVSTGKNVLPVKNKKEKNKEYKPYIYIYNSHQTEEYIPSDFLAYTVKPTVSINNYIMQDVFKSSGYDVLIEERSIKDLINTNNWRYSESYRASRIFLEDVKSRYSSLDIFIDVHRDSLNKDKTTVLIDGKKYAKIIFLIGLENPNYQDNLSFTERINNIIDEKYKGLSKGIYKKGGAGVNGVYNQDFSSKAILVEIGGVDNTIEEVMNSAIVVSRALVEVIRQDEG